MYDERLKDELERNMIVFILSNAIFRRAKDGILGLSQPPFEVYLTVF